MTAAPDMSDLVRFAETLADAARVETLSRFRTGAVADNKKTEGFDPVTAADREAEAAIRRLIEAQFPEHGIFGEEFGVKEARSPFRWVLDPVDGTRAFICGLPVWTTLIALERDEEPVIGLVDQPFTDERWIGSPEGAFHVHRGARTPIRTDTEARLATARLHTTDPRPKPQGYLTEDEAARFAKLGAKGRVTRFGLDAYGYAQIASGDIDAVAEGGVQRYDVAAPIALIRAAGGVVTDWTGGDVFSGERIQIAASANEALHAEVLEALGG